MADSLIRPLTPADLPAALALQADGYPEALWDGEEAFVSRIAVAPDWCWALEREGRLEGYLLSHPWTSMSPPVPDTTLERAEGDIWYIHDLSTARAARGRGVGRALLAACEAAHPQIRRSELVAVDGAEPFWRRLGWRPAMIGPVVAKVAKYGPAAIYMARDWG
ncbi:hypothetical protein ASG17_11130 [Brevundimonas sp. Leaf363]|uniref:GNAT family N-acetyltransferase n=1 Tax=Brevundimonas sp. Leaf363 TaxID=1736353 RepID=UPI0006FEE786|nr:GNAT family N-acetyltransferase [Brevundimonas sp. Leaf363]KQS54201.1 hypothetical protein ASG17_11130 [Brevundimonas sp. Leaf363]